MHSANDVLETRMKRSGIYQMRHTHLFNKTQSLKIWMLNKVKNESRRNSDKSVNRVVNYFFLIQLYALMLIIIFKFPLTKVLSGRGELEQIIFICLIIILHIKMNLSMFETQ